MKKTTLRILITVLVIAILAAITVFAVNGSMQKTLEYMNIKVTLNGERVNLVDANGNLVEPFIIDGTTYLPVRAISSALGLSVDWDDETNTVILNDTNNSLQINDSTIQSILNNETSIVDFDSKQKTTLSALKNVNKKYIGEPVRYAVTDVDCDDELELLVEYTLSGDTAIIDAQNDAFVAYYIPYRGIIGLKVDGTMAWSNSASESGISQIKLGDEGIITTDIVVYNEGLNGSKTLTINGQPASDEEIGRAFSTQHAKPDASWLPIN